MISAKSAAAGKPVDAAPFRFRGHAAWKVPMKQPSFRAAAAVAACAILSACASVDQVAFDHEARALVRDGMPASEAVPRLQDAGFVCSPDGAKPPAFDCVRIRNRLVTSCLERVTFVDTVDNHGAVADVRVAAIACAGT